MTAEGSTVIDDVAELPLFYSLYEMGTDRLRVLEDYASILRPQGDEDPAVFEAELMFHYSMNEAVRESIEFVVAGNNETEDFDRVRAALSPADLSQNLRAALERPR